MKTELERLQEVEAKFEELMAETKKAEQVQLQEVLADLKRRGYDIPYLFSSKEGE